MQILAQWMSIYFVIWCLPAVRVILLDWSVFLQRAYIYLGLDQRSRITEWQRIRITEVRPYIIWELVKLLLSLNCVGAEISGAGRRRSWMSHWRWGEAKTHWNPAGTNEDNLKLVSVCHCLPLNDTSDLQKLLMLFATELFMYWAPQLGEWFRKRYHGRWRSRGSGC